MAPSFYIAGFERSPRGGVIVSSASFDPATIAWVNAVIANGGTVSNTRETLVDNLIKGLKSDGVWTKLDRLWLHAGENQPSALTDIVADALATAVNSPTFTTDRGYTGQDATTPTAYVGTNYDPTANATNLTTNALHLSAWVVGNAAASNGGSIIGNAGSGGTPALQIFDTFTDGNVYVRANDNPDSGSQGAPGTRQGFWLGNRDSSTTSQAYQNGSLFSSPNAGSGALQALNIFVTCTHQAGNAAFGTPNQIAATSLGGSLSSADVTNFYNRLCDYMGGAFADAWARQVVTNGGTVSAARQSLVANLIAGGMRDGWWFKLDRLWLFAAENSQSALTDIVADSLATAVNSPTFTTDRGYTGNGTNMSIDSNVNPSTATGLNFTQNSASFFLWSNTSGSIVNPAGGQSSDRITIYPNQSGTAFWQVNDLAYATSASVADGLGLYHANRSGASAEQGYKNGSQLASTATTSGAISNSDILFLEASAFWSGQLCAGGFGGSLSSTDASNLYARLRTYMTAVGVP